MKLVIFSEEYIKITKGMFSVWRDHAGEASKKHKIDILLNREHWAFNEIREVFRSNSKVSVHGLPFDMPRTTLNRVIGISYDSRKLRTINFSLQILNLVLSPLIIFYLVIWLRKVRPDAVFSHNGGWPAGQLCRWVIVAAALVRVPARVLIIHNYPSKPPRYLGLFLLPLRCMQAWIIDKCATSVVTVSDSVKTILESDVFSHSVSRVYNGISLSSSLQKKLVNCATLDWQSSGLTVGFVGALYPLKGPHILLDAFKLVEVSCELALLGPADDLYLKTLKQKADLCGNRVSFLGFQEDVDSFMQKIDFLVVPSIAFESFGMVILEAMKFKKPVICSDFGGMKEVVEDGVTGLVIPSGDALELAKAITKLLTDANLRNKMGEAGYQRLKRLFTSEKMAANYDAFLQKS